MALTRITQNVIKDTTISEGKFTTSYLNATSSDIAEQPIVFQSNITFRSGSGGNSYLTTSPSEGTITLSADIDSFNVLNINPGSINVSGTVNANHVNISKVKLNDDGTENSPALLFTGAPSQDTGFYRISTPSETLNASVSGQRTLSLSPDNIGLGSNRVDIKTTTDSGTVNYTQILGYDVGNLRSFVGGTNARLSLNVSGVNALNITSVDNNGDPLPNNEKRVGINVTNPTTTLDVGGTIKATSYVGMSSADLPVIPITKGGTGLSSVGISEQLIRVNASRTGFEYFTLNSGDINNLGSFNVSGDGNIYKVLGRGTASFEGTPGFLQLTLNDVSTWRVGQDIKIFGVNTRDINDYSSAGAPANLYNTWKNDQVDGNFLSVTANGTGSSAQVRYTYYSALLNTKTGVVSSLAQLKHEAPAGEGDDYVVNFPLGNFNNNIYNTVPLARPTSGSNTHAILVYRQISFITGNPTPVTDRDGNSIEGHNDRINLIAIVGQRDIGSTSSSNVNYQDYGPFNRTTWGDFNSDGTYSAKYQEMTNIKVTYTVDDILADKPSIPGWTIRTVLAIDEGTNSLTVSNTSNATVDDTSLSILNTYDTTTYLDNAPTAEVPSELTRTGEDFPRYNDIQVCHDDTVGIQTAIEQQILKGQRSLFLIGGTYLVRRLNIPSNFSLIGSGKATIIKKQYFDNAAELISGTREFNRTYAAVWLRDPVDSLGSPSNSTSQPVKDVTVRDLTIDGNYNSNIRFGLSTLAESNALVYAESVRNVNFSSLDIKNSIGDGIYAESATRMSIQNCNIFDNSTTYITFDNPLQATDSTVLKVSDTAFLSNPGPVDITTSEVVALNSCIIRNSGTGLRIFGVRSANTENNLILGPDDEWIPTEDIYDSDYNSVNITCDKTTGTGTGGPIRFTYVENNIAKDLSNTTISTAVYKIKIDVDGNELIDGGPLVYRLNDDPNLPESSVLNSQVYDQESGGVQISIPSGVPPEENIPYDVSLTSGKAVHVIPFRRSFESGVFLNNYNYLVYTLVGSETVAIGGADSYMIEGAVEYNDSTQEYVISIKFDNLQDFQEGDIVTLREHNTPYSIPNNLTVSQIRFNAVVNLWTLRLQYKPSDGTSFNRYHRDNNVISGQYLIANENQNPPTKALVDLASGPKDTQNYKGYIEKKRSFTIAKGIIGVV